jgi:hypothetical protein
VNDFYYSNQTFTSSYQKLSGNASLLNDAHFTSGQSKSNTRKTSEKHLNQLRHKIIHMGSNLTDDYPKVMFEAEAYSFGFPAASYPEFCYITTVNNKTVSIESYNETSKKLCKNSNIEDCYGKEKNRVYFIKNQCPVSKEWKVEVEDILVHRENKRFNTTTLISFSLEGLRNASVLQTLVKQKNPALSISCLINTFPLSDFDSSSFSFLCPTLRQPIKALEKKLVTLKKKSTTTSIKREDYSKNITNDINDDASLVKELMFTNQQLSKKYLKTLIEKLEIFKQSTMSNKALPYLNHTSNKPPPDFNKHHLQASNFFLNQTPCEPCFPIVVENKNKTYFIIEKEDENHIIRCSLIIKKSPLRNIMSLVNARKNEKIQGKPLLNIERYKDAQILLEKESKVIEELRMKHQQNNLKPSLLQSYLKTNFRKAMSSHNTNHSLRTNSTTNPLRKTSKRIHPFAHGIHNKAFYSKKRILQNMNNKVSTASVSALKNVTVENRFKLRQYFYVPKIKKNNDTDQNIYSQIYTDMIDREYEEYLKETKSNKTSSYSFLTVNATNFTHLNEMNLTKKPEIGHIVSPHQEEIDDLSVEPPNRGLFGIGRYVPQSSTSVYKAINTISYGPWFVKWGRNKLEKATEVIVASDIAFVDAAISGTQKEFSIGGGIAKLTGTFSYNEIKQEVAYSIALGNYGVKVDRSQTYNATAVEIFARGFQSGTIINFVDRSFGQRIRIRHFEISVQHDFDDYFYPSDPGFGTEFLVQYRGANFAIANDVAERKLGISVGFRGHNVAVLHDFNQYLTEVQANWGRGWQLSFGWDFPDMYSQSSFVEAGFGKLNRAFIQVGGGIGDDGVPQGLSRLQTRNVGIDVDFLYEFGQRTMQYAFTIGRFSYIWQANIDLSAVRIPTLLGIRPGDVEHLLLSLLPRSVDHE